MVVVGRFSYECAYSSADKSIGLRRISLELEHNCPFVLSLHNSRKCDVLTAREQGCNLTLAADMGSLGPDLVAICTVQGELTAHVIKSHLESEGIPVLLKWESAGRVYGFTVDGLGQVSILVPRELAEEAKHIIEPQEVERAEE